MQNSVLQQVSSQLYNSGYGDNVPDLPMQMDSRLNSNDSNFYLDSSIYSPQDHDHDHDQDQDQLDGVFAICSQVPLNYQYSGMNMQPSFGGAQLTAKSNMQTNYDRKNLLELSQFETLTGRINQYDIRNTRKRPIENSSDYFQQIKSPEDTTVNNKSLKTGWPANKKMSLCFQGQYSHDQFITGEMKEIQKLDKVPARRSQKLADRITALQKLVSPYGKTDTASVLHEASMFIKALLDQIQNLLNDENPSSNEENSNQANGDKQYNLEDKGLCLVPISKTQKLVKEDTMYHYSTMINSPISPHKFSTLL